MTDSTTNRRLISRRSLLLGGSGLLAAYAVGCGDGDKPASSTASPAATATRAAPTPPPTPAPTPGVMRWQRVDVPGPMPAGRRDHSLVTDGIATLFLLGGRNDTGSLGDLWSYNHDAREWNERSADGAPPARFGHNAIWASGLLVFGGQAGGSFFNDTWIYDAARWHQLDAASGPAQRYGAASALNADGRLLVSHGFTNEGRFDDTWSLDASAVWADVSAAGTRPIQRCLCRGAWDTKRNRFLMFGGQTDGTPFLGDLWAFDGLTWTEITTEPKPSPRNFYAMAETDPGRIALFGGNTVDVPGPMNDLWFFDSATDTWTLAHPEGEAPSARYGHDAVWLPDSRRLIAFGGHDTTGDVNDLWELTIPA